MAKSVVNKQVMARATAIVAEGAKEKPAQARPLPMVTLSYPRHGKGTLVNRVVRVLECEGNYIRGFEVEGIDDEGEYKVFDRRKIGGSVELILLEPQAE